MTVLCYHAVDDAWDNELAVRVAEFAEQCLILGRGGRVAPAGPTLARGQHAITFDDGWLSVKQHALPHLQRHRLPATVFVVAGTLVDPPTPVDWVRPPSPDTPPVMTLEDLLELQEAGIDIQSHSWSHEELPFLSEDECLADLRRSKELLEDLLRRQVTQLAYPFGRHAEHVRRAAERAGYDVAYSLPESREPVGQYAVPRAGIYRGNSGRTFRVKKSPLYLGVRMSAPYALLRRASS